MSSVPVFVQTPKIVSIQMTASTSAQPIFTAGTAEKIVAVLVTSSEATLARVISLSYTRGGTTFTLTSASVPAKSGTDGVTTTIDLLSSVLIPGLPIDNDGQRYFFLQNGDVLNATSSTAPTAAAIHVTGIYADF